MTSGGRSRAAARPGPLRARPRARRCSAPPRAAVGRPARGRADASGEALALDDEPLVVPVGQQVVLEDAQRGPAGGRPVDGLVEELGGERVGGPEVDRDVLVQAQRGGRADDE